MTTTTTDPLTPAQHYAEENGLAVVAVIPFELARVAAGAAMIVSTLDGTEVLLRLPTVDELLASCEAAGRRRQEQGLPPGPGMTTEQAQTLVEPIGSGAELLPDVQSWLDWDRRRRRTEAECTHGADCQLHPDARGVHNWDTHQPGDYGDRMWRALYQGQPPSPVSPFID